MCNLDQLRHTSSLHSSKLSIHLISFILTLKFSKKILRFKDILIIIYFSIFPDKTWLIQRKFRNFQYQNNIHFFRYQIFRGHNISQDIHVQLQNWCSIVLPFLWLNIKHQIVKIKWWLGWKYFIKYIKNLHIY